MDTEEVRRLLDYDPDTGVFRWKIQLSNRIKVGDVAGCRNPNGYIKIRIHGVGYWAHRLAYLHYYGEWPKNEIDHGNHDKSDNSIVNLSSVTSSGNNKNLSTSGNNTSGEMGVYKNKPTGKWEARITENGVQEYLGLFDNFDDAVRMRHVAEIEYNFHENHGRKTR